MDMLKKAGYYVLAILAEALTLIAAGAVWLAEQAKRLARGLEE